MKPPREPRESFGKCLVQSLDNIGPTIGQCDWLWPSEITKCSYSLIHWPFECSPLSSNRVLWHSVAGGNQSKNYSLSQGLYNFISTIFKTLSIIRFETIFLFSAIIFPLHFEFVADPWNKKFGNVPLICYRHWTTLLHPFANKLVAVQVHRHISQTTTYLRENAIPNFLGYWR